MSDKLFIFGFGFSAKAIAEKSIDRFDTIYGTTRSPDKVQEINAAGCEGLLFDGSSMNETLLERLQSSSHLLISIAPGEQDPVLSSLPNRLEAICPNLAWIGYLSTVGVYGNHDGAWVDEDTPPKPVSQRSIQRVMAENAWQETARDAEIPLCIFRLSGIYGPGRNAFTTIEKGKARRLVKPGQVFNRIHCGDIATAVSQAMRGNIGGIFNITDNEPSPPQDVVTYAHELMGIEPPEEIDFETADLSPMARSFYGENKRVNNNKSKSDLPMIYDWPDYRTSLKRMWEEECWR